MSIESFEQLFHQLNGTDDDLRRAADESLTELVNDPESIKTLLEFFQNFGEKPQLQEFVVILLGRSITLNIEKIDEQSISEITSLIIETFVGSGSYQDSFLNISRTIYKQFPQTQEIFESAFECLSENPILLFGLLNVLMNKENYEKYAQYAESALSLVQSGENIFNPFMFLLNIVYFYSDTSILSESLELLKTALFSLFGSGKTENLIVALFTLRNISEFDGEFVLSIAPREELVDSLSNKGIPFAARECVLEYLLYLIPRLDLSIEDIVHDLDVVIQFECEFHAENPLDRSISSEEFSPLTKLIPKENADEIIGTRIAEMASDETSCYVAIILLESYCQYHSLIEGANEFLLGCIESDSLMIRLQAINTSIALETCLCQFFKENNESIARVLIESLEACKDGENAYYLNDFLNGIVFFLRIPFVDHTSYITEMYILFKELSLRDSATYEMYYFLIAYVMISIGCSDELEEDIRTLIMRFLNGPYLDFDIIVMKIAYEFVEKKNENSDEIITAALNHIFTIGLENIPEIDYYYISKFVCYLNNDDERLQGIFAQIETLEEFVDVSNPENYNRAKYVLILLAQLIKKMDKDDASQLIDFITEKMVAFVESNDEDCLLPCVTEIMNVVDEIYRIYPDIIEEEHFNQIIAFIKEQFESEDSSLSVSLKSKYTCILNSILETFGAIAFNESFQFFVEFFLVEIEALSKEDLEEEYDYYFTDACNFIRNCVFETLPEETLERIITFFMDCLTNESKIHEMSLDVFGDLLESGNLDVSNVAALVEVIKGYLMGDDDCIISSCARDISIIAEKNVDCIKEDANELFSRLMELISEMQEYAEAKDYIISAVLAMLEFGALPEAPVEEIISGVIGYLPPLSNASNAIFMSLCSLFERSPNLHEQYLDLFAKTLSTNAVYDNTIDIYTLRRMSVIMQLLLHEYDTNFDAIFGENKTLAKNASIAMQKIAAQPS